MLFCKSKDARLGLMSTTKSFMHMTVKNNWVRNRYEIDLENFCVGTFDAKLEMLIAISKAYNIKRNRILLVDDYWMHLEKCAESGFQTASPLEAINYILKENNK